MEIVDRIMDKNPHLNRDELVERIRRVSELKQRLAACPQQPEGQPVKAPATRRLDPKTVIKGRFGFKLERAKKA